MSLEVGLTIEGQEGVSWPQWLDLARVAEEHGFVGLYRSDHYLSEHSGSNRDALDAWGTICGLAAVTSKIRLGTLVSPITFRHPSVLAKLAVTAEHISNGRVDVGIGAGWYLDEHIAYGFDLPDQRTRFEMLEEQLEILTRAWAPEPFSFHGRHYRLDHNDARPKPTRTRPRLTLGGSGGPRSLDLAANWADEYNVAAGAAEVIRGHGNALASACERRDRDPATLALSVLAGVACGRDQSEIEERAARVCRFLGYEFTSPSTAIAALPTEWLIGTPEEVARQLGDLESLGVARVILWPPLHDDLEMVDLIGSEVLPAIVSH